MAEGRMSIRKPRVRKAPTVRERQEEAQAKAAQQQPRRLRRAGSKVTKPLRKVRLPLPARVKKVLSWLVPRYFVNAWRELRQTTWPSRRETWRLTLAVFVFAAVFGALVAGVDKGLDEIFKNVVLK